MNFNLNDDSLINGGSIIFNNGIAGKVENVKISVTKRAVDEPDSYPDYKLIVTDKDGGFINQGFYHHKDKDGVSEEQNNKNAGYLIGRILSVAHAVVEPGYVFPDVSGKSPKEIVDILFKIIKDNCEDKLVNVFTNYGNKTKPSQYLQLRFFNFIEKPGVEKSKLVVNGNDLLEKIVEDSSSAKNEEKLDW